MKDYVKTLKKEHIFQSMSRKGNCLDNNVMENFFGLLKQEMYYGHVYHSFEELKQAIEGYITYYNTQITILKESSRNWDGLVPWLTDYNITWHKKSVAAISLLHFGLTYWSHYKHGKCFQAP